MAELVLDIVQVELVGREADQALLIDVDGQRLQARHQDVDAEIALVASDQEWVRYVPLDNTWVVEVTQLADVVHQENLPSS